MSDTRGFTLVEMLVSVVVLALAMAMILPSMANLSGLAGRAQSDGGATLDAKLALKMVESDLRKAVGTTPNFGTRPITPDELQSVLEKPSIRVPAYPTEPKERLLDDATYHDLVSFNKDAIVAHSDVVNTNPQGWFNSDTSPGAETVSYMFFPLGSNCTRDKAVKHSSPWCLWRQIEYTQTGDIDPKTGKLRIHRMAEMVMRGSAFPTVQCFDNGPARKRMFCFKQAAPVPKNPAVNPYSWSNWTNKCQTRWFEDGGHSTWTESPYMGLGWFQMSDQFIGEHYPNWSQPGEPELVLDRDGRMNLTGAPPAGVPDLRDYYYPAYHTPTVARHLFMMDTVVGIGIVMPSSVAKSGAEGSAVFQTQVSLRNRLSPSYQQSILCGLR